MTDLIVATNVRGAMHVGEWPGIRATRLGDENAQVIWQRDPMTADDIEHALPRMQALRWIHCDRAGIDGLPLQRLRQLGVTVTKTDAYTKAVSEWIITAVLMAAKGAQAYVRASDKQQWLPGVGHPRLVCGTRATIVGAGAIAKRAKIGLDALGLTAVCTGRTGQWRTLLSQTDWLILACPLTDQTAGMVGADELARLAAGAWLINVGRGALVDPIAVRAARRDGTLGGLVTDTDDGDRYYGLTNTLVLPHDTWRAKGAGARQVQCFTDQLRRFAAGLPLQRVANLAAGY